MFRHSFDNSNTLTFAKERQEMQIVPRHGTRVILFGDAEKQITGDKHAKIVCAQ